MQNHCFKFLFFFFCILFLNTKIPLSESERPSLDFNEKQKTIVSNALSNCGDYNFDDLLNTRKKELGISDFKAGFGGETRMFLDLKLNSSGHIQAHD